MQIKINDKVKVVNTNGIFCDIGEVGIVVDIKYRYNEKRYVVKFIDCLQDCTQSNIHKIDDVAVGDGKIKSI